MCQANASRDLLTWITRKTASKDEAKSSAGHSGHRDLEAAKRMGSKAFTKQTGLSERVYTKIVLKAGVFGEERNLLAHETKGIFASLLLSDHLKNEYYLWSPVYPIVYIIHHVGLNYRTTKDIDFWYDGPVPRLQFKRDLARHNRGLYTENFEAVNAVTWRCPATKTIVSIDIVGSDVTYFPPKSRVLSELADGDLPWASRDDLILQKAVSCGEREDGEKMMQDANDIMALLKNQPGHLEFKGLGEIEERKWKVLSCLPALVNATGITIADWKNMLGI